MTDGGERSRRGLAWHACVLAAAIGAATNIMAQDPGLPGCLMSEVRDDAPIMGFCPTEGGCDLPGVRSLYVTDDATPLRWLRMHFIVFRDDKGGDPGWTEEDLAAEAAALNADYLPWRVQFTPTFEFVDDSEYRYGSGDDFMKRKYARDPASQCNVFVTGLTGGVGTFPWWFDALLDTGGIQIGAASALNRPHLLSHEVGHCLGLWHTHRGVDEVTECGDCYESPGADDRDEVGDFCADTPPRPIDPFVCEPPGGNDPCSGAPWGDTQPENIMSYGYTCWDRFTPQQAARTHCWSEDVLVSWSDCDVGDDCNENDVSDRCDIRDGTSADVNRNWIPDECESCRVDIDGNGVVDFEDLLRVLAVWGPCNECPEDLDGSGEVDFGDILQVLAAWGPCVQPLGACCFSDGTCSRVVATQCRTDGGLYQGDDTICFDACVPTDHCQHAPRLGDGTYPYSTVDVSTDGGPVPPECDEGHGVTFQMDVWVRYVASCSGVATASLCDSDFDVRVAVYSGDFCYNTFIACNDDACGDGGTRSRVEFAVQSGEEYLIRIGGSAEIGAGQLVIECAAGD